MLIFLYDIGAIVRWLLKGCKTKLSDEMDAILDSTWGSSYKEENFIIGAFSVLILFVSFGILGSILGWFK